MQNQQSGKKRSCGDEEIEMEKTDEGDGR